MKSSRKVKVMYEGGRINRSRKEENERKSVHIGYGAQLAEAAECCPWC